MNRHGAPKFWAALLFGLIVLAAAGVSTVAFEQAAWAQGKGKKPAAKAPAKTEPAKAASKLGDAKAGETLYKQYCLSCHGENGDGKGPVGAVLQPPPRNFTDPAVMKAITDDQMVKVIAEGGPAIGKSPVMAPWKAVLNEQQVKDVAAYVRAFVK